MNDYPIRVGSMLFTLVDPNKGHEVEYNRWYERDHFYAGCLIGPWLFGGSRWVATRSLKDLRFPQDSTVATPVDRGSYLAIYWMLDGYYDKHYEWAIKQVQDLYANDRGFHERTHAHTALFQHPWAVYRDEYPVPLELAHDHRYEGLVVVAMDITPDTNAKDLTDLLQKDAMPKLMKSSSISIGCGWTPMDRGDSDSQSPMDLGTPSGGNERIMQLFFLDKEPTADFARFKDYAAQIDDSGMAKTIFVAPFLPTIVGTDTYTDQLF